MPVELGDGGRTLATEGMAPAPESGPAYIHDGRSGRGTRTGDSGADRKKI